RIGRPSPSPTSPTPPPHRLHPSSPCCPSSRPSASAPSPPLLQSTAMWSRPISSRGASLPRLSRQY
ncbi:hypothetical protein ACHAXT_001375, partial [Thalassiosira profunda]